jgi:tripartite-type tricarboxylate transporter receptor subunit TctC
MYLSYKREWTSEQKSWPGRQDMFGMRIPLAGRSHAGAAAVLALGLVCAAWPAGRAAAEYPDRAIRIIVPFAPGGSSDATARLLSGPLSEALKQPVVIENRAGAGGSIGIAQAAKAAPDGYTLLVSSNAYVINSLLDKQQLYDPKKDFEFITEINSSPNLLVANPKTGIKSFDDLRKRATADQKPFFYSTAGVGTPSHLAGELLKIRTGINIQHVAYSGAGPATLAVLGSDVPLALSSLSVVVAQVKAGALVGVLQTGDTAWPGLTDVPTVIDAKLPDATSDVFQAIFAPAGTPKAIVERIERETLAILAKPDMQEKMIKAGFIITGKGSSALKARVDSDMAKYKEVIDKAGITVR